MKNRIYKWHPDEVKNSIDAHEFYLIEQNLDHYTHKTGQWAVAGLCPFHNDKRPGSFKVNLTTGAFKCYSCGEYGHDIITFTQKKNDIGFIEAMEKLSYDWEVC